jgi:hypothetical protein
MEVEDTRCNLRTGVSDAALAERIDRDPGSLPGTGREAGRRMLRRELGRESA